MLNKRLIGMVSESKRYIAGNVLCQWISLVANLVMMVWVTNLLASLFTGTLDQGTLLATLGVAAGAVVVRCLCTTFSSRMGYLASSAVKKTLREKIYGKLLRLGSSYQEKVNTSEVVQVAVEGVDQLETYFGSYLPQLFYAVLAPVTLFVVLAPVSLPAAVVLLVCVPLIPVAIVAVQRWAKKLLARERLKKSGSFEGRTDLRQIFSAIDREAEALLSQVGMSAKAGSYPCQLSGGQQQRAAIARALALKPDILCFDEPTSALDPGLTGEVLKVIRSLKNGESTMIVVTHEMAFARRVSDRVMFLSEGKIEEMGPPEQVFTRPRSEKTSAFLRRSEEDT